MVKDSRLCLGCSREVPSLLRAKLSNLGWTFIEVREGKMTIYYSNCGCISHEDFMELIKKKEAKADGGNKCKYRAERRGQARRIR